MADSGPWPACCSGFTWQPRITGGDSSEPARWGEDEAGSPRPGDVHQPEGRKAHGEQHTTSGHPAPARAASPAPWPSLQRKQGEAVGLSLWAPGCVSISGKASR